MKEKIRRCLNCMSTMQLAGIQVEMLPSAGGKNGTCPGCKKRKLCYDWKIERKKREAERAAYTD